MRPDTLIRKPARSSVRTLLGLLGEIMFMLILRMCGGGLIRYGWFVMPQRVQASGVDYQKVFKTK
jgi:hypothetical protein